ncbi:histidinol-phosphatase [Fodinicurvata sediminis]|uniref:histidinol-phosphatase n=1 Tax=Fodinicurvata sediminis TaxID=1121832 RepID=UPI0003B6DA40|nr:histidinol-phosphatase [Fodinicurvata sediminis]
MSDRLTTCPQNLVDFAEELAGLAAAVARSHFRTSVSVDTKADESPVTIADRNAEEKMRAAISARFPGHGVFGEEFGAENPDAEYLWVLDPIDGTKAFITGNPLFGTLVSLLHRGQPILGIIEMPALGERWIGASGHPTRRRDSAGVRETKTRACSDLGRAIMRTTSPDMFPGRQADAYDRLSAACGLTLFGGDCFCYAQLASGYVDLVVEASLKPYDFMALLPVVIGAGGMATDWEGKPLSLDSPGDILVAGDPEAHARALALLSGKT